MSYLLKKIGGAFTHRPDELKTRLSRRASNQISAAFNDVDAGRLVDYHTHVAGAGAGGTGNFVNPVMRSWWHPTKRLKFAVYMSASGVNKTEEADREFVLRLVDLVRNIANHGKYHLLAFDKHYRSDGTVNLEKTEFFVSNEYVFALAEEFPDLFLPTISVHPYRSDALIELEKWARRGGSIVKWLPNAMGIDPSDPQCDPFYQKMKELGLALLSHGGEEKAVEAEEDQKLGNPLLLRRPLDHGIKVIIAHCAGLGKNEDLDSPRKEEATNFDLFLRLMDDKKYEGLLFADISAMTQINRMGKPLTTIIERKDLHPRLVNGSDYPLPAINFLISTRSLMKAGYITGEERADLNEIYDYNPLLFDFVLKRCLKAPDTGSRLPPSVFMANPGLSI